MYKNEATIDATGYPDNGTGWYSKELKLEEWVKLNSAQRIFANYVEHLPILTICSLVSGIYYINIALICTWVYLLGRYLYAIGYQKAPQYRICGFLVIMLCTLTLIVVSILTVIQLMYRNSEVFHDKIDDIFSKENE